MRNNYKKKCAQHAAAGDLPLRKPLPTKVRAAIASGDKPASPHKPRGRRNQNCSRSKGEQFCFPRFARAGVGAGPRFVIAQVPKNHWNLCTPRGQALAPRYATTRVPENHRNMCAPRGRAFLLIIKIGKERNTLLRI
jgi:hypothetical protein